MSEEESITLDQSSAIRLALSDVPLGEPLAWPIVSADGALLLNAGAIIAGAAERAFLFAHFEPHRLEDSAQSLTRAAPALESSSSGAELLTLETIGLKIGARLGLRGSAASAMYSSRVIGFSTPGPQRTRAVFITQPVMAGHEPLALSHGERVELVALGTRAVFQFACTVDAVCREPFSYLILSEPGAIRRLRARRFVRMVTRLPAHFSAIDSGQNDVPTNQLGLIRDISPFGMSLAVPEAQAKLGDRLRLSFRFNTDDTDVDIDCHAIVRHVHNADARSPDAVYGLEFETLEPSQRIALKSFMAEQI
ncbi:pilus assembly protein PilZ [Burkholderia sp. Leaf177]|uniref:flagellar brake protein n=1 Tax=Burkholderia sp. Leaf177 TaxID=1736287 RepID=UPI0006F5D036|nr:flagellar brake protein [Burkholderia sp. Leaf177]KQR74017.1 pilus assembly protein PilZ [Burkholderia sp. Leaf177]